LSTIFLNGLMPDRHSLFIRRLAARHTVAGTHLDGLTDLRAGRFLDYAADRDLMRSPLAEGFEGRLAEQIRILAGNLAADLRSSPVGPGPDWRLDPAFIEESLRPRVTALLTQDLRFRVFAQQHPVDLVVSGSDYASHSRVIALAARDMGLPTLNLEHGFFFNQIASEHRLPRGRMPLIFASEYVNLDNDLEKEWFEQERARFPHQDLRFLSLGTPVDSVASQALSRSEATAALGLNPDKVQVMLAGSWLEARSAQALVAAQVDTVDLYENLFRSLAADDFRHRMQLTIKLHPADARPDVLPGVVAGLADLADDCGLVRPLILSDRLPEVLGAADVVLALGYSSVLYDAFLLGKPSVAVFPRVLAHSDKPDWMTRSTAPQRAGVSVATTDGAEAWRLAQAWLEPERQRRFAADHLAFSDRYGLRQRTPTQKCDAVIGWIEQQLAG
jgi:hypothetical protein